ncbi:MAG TPA: tol-pal system protein YbgF, partial [Oceanospirillales bacterium]|nr:tol-pal system protein YbgF [Oceanospirillales bacterium]
MKIQILIISTLMLFLNAEAKDLSIQQRLAKVEKLLKQQDDNRTHVADIVIQNQTLQQQIAELKGVIEEQNHQIQSLKEKQKLLYIDVDSRLSDLEAKNSPSNPNPQSTGDATPATQPATVEVAENYGETSTATAALNDEPVLSSAQDDYDIAFAHLRGGRFLESARAFEDFIQKYPQNELTDNAYYWLGESYYVKRQYPQALSAFQSLTEKFPDSAKAADSWLKIGYSYYEMDDFVKADENLKKVINNNPNTSIARLS